MEGASRGAQQPVLSPVVEYRVAFYLPEMSARSETVPYPDVHNGQKGLQVWI